MNTGDSASRKFYVYFHKDKSGKVFYVGKGTGPRAYSRGQVLNHL